MNIFVAKLNYNLNEQDLAMLFDQYGEIESIKLVTDRDTGKSKGYAFIEMPNDDEGNAAIEGLDGKEVEGFNIVVKKARPKEEYNRESRPRNNFRKRDDRDGGYNKGGNDRYNKRY